MSQPLELAVQLPLSLRRRPPFHALMQRAGRHASAKRRFGSIGVVTGAPAQTNEALTATRNVARPDALGRRCFAER